MNCKPGDLAVVVRSPAGNEGRIVRCVAFVGKATFLTKHGGKVTQSDVWRVEPALVGVLGDIQPLISDSKLRPLRDSDGTDETLIYAPLDKTVKVD